MSRRLLIVALSAVAVLAAACSAPPTTGGKTPVAQGSGTGAPKLPTCPLAALKAAKGPITVHLWYGGLGGATQTTMESVAADFNKAHAKATAAGPAIRIVPVNRGKQYAEVLQGYESAASGHKSQLPGLIYLEDNTVLEMANSGNVLPAQSCMEADHYDETDIMPAVRAEYTVNDVLWPGYMNVSAPVLYYNKVDFVKAGLDPSKPPSTLAEIEADAKILKAKGVAPTPFAFKRDAWFFTEWVNGAGGSVLSGDNGRKLGKGEVPKATFDNPQGLAALTWLKKMQDEKLMVSFDQNGGPTGIDHYLTLLPDAAGHTKAAMLLETSSASTTIKGVLAGKITGQDAGINFDSSVIDKSALVPGTGAYPGETQGGQVATGGGAYYILNTTPPAEQAASWEFLKYLLQPANVFKWHSVGGYLPTTKSMQALPQAATFSTNDLAGVLLQPATQQLLTADPDRPAPLIGPYQDYADAVQGAMDKVILSGASPASALAAAQTTATAALAQYGG